MSPIIPQKQTAGTADLVLRHGRFATFTDHRPDDDAVESVAVRDGRIVATGSDAGIRSLIGAGTHVIDLHGRCALPGLNDSHLHAVRAGLSWASHLHWEDVRTGEQARASIGNAVSSAEPGAWISVLGGWHPRQLRDEWRPTRSELDQLAPQHPVYLQQLYESATLNSAALAACGWTDESPDPARGTLVRDAAGALTGVVRGVGAFNTVLEHAVPTGSSAQIAGTEAMFAALASFGITGVVDGGGMAMDPADYVPLFDLWRTRGLSVRTRLFVCAWTPRGEVADIAALLQLAHPDFGDGTLRYAGVGEMPHAGFHDFEGLDPAFSVTDAAFDDLVDITRRCVARDWRMSMHAVLDETLSRILDAWELVEAQTGRLSALRFSIVHADGASERSLRRLRDLGGGVLVQDRTMLMGPDYVRAWGRERADAAPPIGLMRELGLPLGAGTDAFRANWHSPWASIWWLVSGATFDRTSVRRPADRLSRHEAIAAYTRGSAWFTGEDDHRGRIAAGYDADFCVPTRDPFACDEDELLSLRSDLTIMGGRVTHAAGDFLDHKVGG